MTNNTYGLLQDILPVLKKHGIVIDLDGGVHIRKRRRFLDPRGAPDRVELVIQGRFGGSP